MAEAAVSRTTTARSGGEPARGGRRVLLPLGLAAFITALDSSVTSVAAPTIQRDLDLSLSSLEWIAACYLLAFGGLMLLGGRLTDMLGRRRVLQLGLWLFCVSSIGVAVAPGPALILTGRTLQGVAAALIVPAAFALVAVDMGYEDRHLGAAVFTGAVGGAIALGPVVGGSIAEYLHWSFIFWINVPVVVVASWAVARAVPKQEPARYGVREWLSRLDGYGLLFSTMTLCGITFALVEGGNLGYRSVPVLAACALVAVGVLGTVVAERRAAYPMLDLPLVRHRLVAGSLLCQLLWGLGINGVVFFTSLFLQNVVGLPPTAAGLVFVPLAVTVAAVVPFSGKLSQRYGTHRVVALGMVLMAGGLMLVGTVGHGDPVWRLLPAVVVMGVGSAFTVPMVAAPMDVVPVSRAGVVSALLSVSREMAGVLGIALTGAVVVARQNAVVDGGATELAGFLSGYRAGLMLGAAVSLVGAVVAWFTLFPGQAMLPDPATPSEPIDVDPIQDIIIDLTDTGGFPVLTGGRQP
ncbi:MFS transporter [Spongisporangium articulatum]|uniref:MFS transporter n=1 Tax=Spongisporangium articulatum TaxID=3362603 RepID=A0ABW8AIL5_9ACTN